MKVISFSIWGTNPTYTVGAVRNADLALQLLPEWTCVFYCWDSVPLDIVKQLESRPNVIIRRVEGDYDPSDSRGMFHRFYPADEIGVERMICRDTDSRLSQREVLAINEWIAQRTDFHIMRDHPYHGTPILGGMWGVVGGKLIGICEEIYKFTPTSEKGQDQQFLTSWVWNKIIKGDLTTTVHDGIFTPEPFPAAASRGADNGGVWFVGQVFDEHDRYNSQSDVDLVKETHENRSS